MNGCCVVAFSQGANTNDFISLKNMTPPAPEATAMARYGEIPTDMSTGVPQISIPVYEIKSGKLSVPISFSYHASGIKLQDVPTPVGLGWVLNAGGEISRSIVGKPDEAASGLLNMSTNAHNTFKNRDQLMSVRYNGDDYEYLEDMAKGYQDCQSDNYNYSAGNLSGKFLYDVNKQLHFTPIDRQPIITWNQDSTFTVIDDAGDRYYYYDKEHTVNEFSNAGNNITGWHLTKIISADGADSISFFYIDATTFDESTESFGFSIVVPNTNVPNVCSIGDPSISYSNSNSVYSHERKLIDSIKFSNGYVKFNYVNDRQDILPERLSEIKIGNSEEVIKKIQLTQSYFQSDGGAGIDSQYTKRLRLDTVKFDDKNSQLVNKYSFEYNTTQLPAYHIYNIYQTASPQMDYWGYYNGNGATSLLPKHFYNDIYSFLHSYYYAVSSSVMSEYLSKSGSRYANPSVMDACILKKINYPTGGYTAFEYETNSINDSGDSSSYRGGLRVSKIVSFDTVNRKPIVKSYVYDSAVAISGNIPRDLFYQQRNITACVNAPNSQQLCVGYCETSNFQINSNPFTAINYYNGSPVIYPKVTEYNGFPGLYNGKTVYEYECELDSNYSPDYTDKYWNFNTDKSWARGNLLNKKVYKLENDSNILIKETKNYYSAFGQQSVKVGQICERATIIFGSITGDLASYMMDTIFMRTYGDRFFLNHYEYLDVVLQLGVKKLVKTEDIDYLDHNLTKTQEFFYEGTNHLYQTKVKTQTSLSSDTLIEITKYPQDKSSISSLSTSASDALDGMITHNILTTPIQIEQYRNNSVLLFRHRIDFKNWSNNRFYEEYRYTSKGTSTLEPRLQYKSYDVAGNPTKLSQYNGTDISYVWSYDRAYATAQVTNASDDEIAYTSFETNDLGNWNIPSNNRVTNASATGSKSFDLSNTYVAKYGLPSGKYYIVTYWSQNGSATVNGASGTSKKTKNGWTLYEHRLSNSTTSVNITGSVTIDELRLYPEDAQMVSYSYKPLVGITSSCSINDIISYYEYDDYGRLKTIRDYDKNILKTIDYKYNETQGQGVVGWSVTGNSVVGSGLSELLSTREEKDYNSSSATYNQTRGVAIGLMPNLPSWVSTGQTRCIVVGGVNTGYFETEYIDQNPYSSKYHKKKWGNPAMNYGMCPPPCDQIWQKLINNVCENGVRVDTGSYYDSNTGLWTCIYHYVWSDQSYSIDYSETHTQECPQNE